MTTRVVDRWLITKWLTNWRELFWCKERRIKNSISIKWDATLLLTISTIRITHDIAYFRGIKKHTLNKNYVPTCTGVYSCIICNPNFWPNIGWKKCALNTRLYGRKKTLSINVHMYMYVRHDETQRNKRIYNKSNINNLKIRIVYQYTCMNTVRNRLNLYMLTVQY